MDHQDDQPPVADGDVRPPRAGRTFRIVKGAEPPPGAVRPQNPKHKGELRMLWWLGILDRYGTQARIMRVASIIERLSFKTGYCFAGDEILSAYTGLPRKRVEEALSTLDRDGAIVRVHARRKGGERGELQRRVYLGEAVTVDGEAVRDKAHPPPQNGGDTLPPRNRGEAVPPQKGGTERGRRERHTPHRRNLSTADIAREAAEHRHRREPGGVADWLKD